MIQAMIRSTELMHPVRIGMILVLNHFDAGWIQARPSPNNWIWTGSWPESLPFRLPTGLSEWIPASFISVWTGSWPESFRFGFDTGRSDWIPVRIISMQTRTRPESFRISQDLGLADRIMTLRMEPGLATLPCGQDPESVR